MKLKDLDDVRSLNKDYFKLHEYIRFDTYGKLISKLYGEWVKWAHFEPLTVIFITYYDSIIL